MLNKKGRLHLRLNYAIILVGDMNRSVSFYRDTIGLPLKFQSPGWTEFATEGATLALHKSELMGAHRDDPDHVPAGRCRPGLCVSNLDDFHARMVQKAVTCVQEPKDVFGARIAHYLDPDGLTISVAEENRGK